MSNIVSRASVMAVVPEDTEGTPKAPSAATEYITLRAGDPSIAPNFEVLESQNVRNSIGGAKPLLGLEGPSYAGGHELRHSGTEGQAPDTAEILTAAFGAEDVQSTEYDTVNGSTTTVVKLDSGEGSNIQRGSARLIKDTTNGYSIRPVESISTDDLTLAFPIDNAPASGVNTGKAVTYYPADTGHQTLTFWHYLGNGGAKAFMSGSRIVDLALAFDAGQIITMDYTAEGTNYYFNGIEITSSTRYIDWTDDDGTFAAAIEAKWYKSPHAVASALQTAMNDVSGVTNTFTVSYSDSTGKFTITHDENAGSTLSLLWNSGTNSSNTIGSKIGFTTASDDTGTGGSTGYTSDDAQDFSAPQTPSYDDADGLVAKDNEVWIGDGDETATFSASSVQFSMGTPKRDILDVNAESGKSGSIVQSRTVTVTVTGLLPKYEADKFNRFAENSATRFAYIFGSKSGSNWEAGKCGCLYMPTTTITTFEVTEDDGLVGISITAQSYVNSDGDGEVYLSFV